MPWIYVRYGVWRAKISVNGHVIYRSLRTPATTKRPPADVVDRARELERRLRMPAGELSWAAAAQQHEQEYRAHDRQSPETHSKRTRVVNGFLASLPAGARVPDRQAATRQLADYLTGRLQDCEPTTVEGSRIYLRSWCAWLMRTGRVQWDRNPAGAAQIVLPAGEERIPEVMTPAEDAALADRLRGTACWRLRCLMRLAGLRTSEALGLHWDRVQDRSLHVVATRSTKTRTKTHRDREVPVSEALAAELRAWDHRSPWVACSPRGHRWSRRNATRAWERDTAGLPEPCTRTYSCRRTAITRWLEAGMPPATAAAIAGNSVDVIMRYYARLDVHQAVRFML